jgi:hypothetical protein
MMRARHLGLATVVVASALLMAGCAASKPDIAAQAAAQWQTRVVAIAEYAAAGDPAAALVDLAALETETAEARAAGELSAERAARIEQAILLVRADLESRAAETPAPQNSEPSAVVVEPAPAPAPVENAGNGGNGNGPENKGPKEDKGSEENKGPKEDKSDSGKGAKGRGKDD